MIIQHIGRTDDLHDLYDLCDLYDLYDLYALFPLQGIYIHITGRWYDLQYVAHVAAWEPYNLHDLGTCF